MPGLTLLSTYVLRIRQKLKQDPLILSKFDKEGTDFLSIFNDFLNYRIGNHYKALKDKAGRRKSLYFKQGDTEMISERTIHVFLYLDFQEKRVKKLMILQETISIPWRKIMLRFYQLIFFLYVPENRRDAYLILQKKSNDGIKNLFEDACLDYFSKIRLKI